MTGPVEAASQTAQTVVEALKSTPMVMAIVIFNVLFMVLTAFAVHEGGARWERLVEIAFHSCGPPK